MLRDIITYDSSDKFVIFIHGLNYYGSKYHYIGTKTIRDLLTVSSALFYKNIGDNDLEKILKSFNECIKNITIDIILIGHSVGGSYARYIGKNNNQIKKVITLDSSYPPEYIPYIFRQKNINIIGEIKYKLNKILMNNINYINDIYDMDDDFIDHNEEKNVYKNSFLAGEIDYKEIAFFYEEDTLMKDDTFKIKKITNNYIYIYTKKYNHSLHMNKNIARYIISFI
jgi:hypothetical protein